MRRWITLHSISVEEHRFLRGVLWASLGLLAVSVMVFIVLVTARPVSGRVGRKVIGVLFLLAALAAEGLLYYWMRHYTHKKIIERADPMMYGLFRVVMLGGGIVALLFTAVLFSRS